MAPDLSLDLARMQAAISRWFTSDTRQGFFATDRAFGIVVWNRWMEIHSGLPASEATGRSLFEIYPEMRDRGIDEYYEAALLGRVTVLSHALHRHLLPFPATNPELSSAAMPQSGHVGPLADGDTIIGTVTILEDVSDRLASEAALRKQIEAQQLARVAAERASRAKEDFLSTLSHEIRTPLNAVLGWARILLGRSDVDRQLLTRALGVIERNAAAQAKMIDDMLDMARIVSGKLRLEMEPVDLLSVVLAALDVVAPSASAKGITIRTSLDPAVPRVLGDHDRLQQVTWNLLSNALKFTEPGGAVDVRLDVVGKAVRLVVADTGQGISPEFLPYLFERFRQNDASSARRHGGLGLGLALARELVELHGGNVRAASDGLNKGATFTIELPALVATGPEPQRQPRNAQHATAPTLRGVRVLLVEDDSDARELAVTTLEYRGASVTAVSSTSEAMTALLGASRGSLPHVVVSDIGMPSEDGYELIRRMRSLQPEQGGQIPAITVSGYAAPEDVQRVLAAGYQAHLAKPINPEALVAAIAQLVRAEHLADPSA